MLSLFFTCKWSETSTFLADFLFWRLCDCICVYLCVYSVHKILYPVLSKSTMPWIYLKSQSWNFWFQKYTVNDQNQTNDSHLSCFIGHFMPKRDTHTTRHYLCMCLIHTVYHCKIKHEAGKLHARLLMTRLLCQIQEEHSRWIERFNFAPLIDLYI